MALSRLLVRIEKELLCGGEANCFQEALDPSVLELQEGDELSCASEVRVAGRVYRASEWFVVEGRIEAALKMPCMLCNEPFELTIVIPSWRVEVAADAVLNGTLDLTGPLREEILLEVPLFARCGGGECRNADTIRQYLRPAECTREEAHQPFLSLL